MDGWTSVVRVLITTDWDLGTLLTLSWFLFQCHCSYFSVDSSPRLTRSTAARKTDHVKHDVCEMSLVPCRTSTLLQAVTSQDVNDTKGMPVTLKCSRLKIVSAIK